MQYYKTQIIDLPSEGIVSTMKNLKIQIEISPEFYVKDPDSTELGRKIVSESIILMNEIGYESFTFRKLGEKIGSPESSVYRYFENKHSLLVYLICWYWNWVEYRLVFATHSLATAEAKLRTALQILTEKVTEDHAFSHINEVMLSEIIISESAKAYHTKEVDMENKKGYFADYKRVVSRVSDMVLGVKSDFEFPHMLISTVVEGTHQQRFFADHLPKLTDKDEGLDNISRFYTEMVFKLIKE